MKFQRIVFSGLAEAPREAPIEVVILPSGWVKCDYAATEAWAERTILFSPNVIHQIAMTEDPAPALPPPSLDTATPGLGTDVPPKDGPE